MKMSGYQVGEAQRTGHSPSRLWGQQASRLLILYFTQTNRSEDA